MDILASDWARANSLATISIRVSNVNGLVQEYDVCI